MQVVFPFSEGHGAAFQMIMLIIAIYYPATINGVSSNCTTEKVYENESGKITCHFSEDISISKTDVIVYVIKVGTILNNSVCEYHFLKENEPPNILHRHGYDCKSNLTTTLVVKIPNATSDHSGIYTCVVALDEGGNFANCSMTVEGQVKLPQDVHLTCPDSDLFNGTQINLTCTVSTDYSSKCAAQVQEAQFRVSYDENAYLSLCTIKNVSQCDFHPNTEGCGCVGNNNTHYTFKYTFIGAVSHNITWDCFINCLDESLNPTLTYDTKFCRRRNIEIRKTFNGPSNAGQSLDTGLIIGIVVGAVVLVAICVIVLLIKFKEKICSKLQGSGSETSKVRVTNVNQDKTETDTFLPVQVQKDTEMKDIEDLPKPVQEQTEANGKQEKQDD